MKIFKISVIITLLALMSISCNEGDNKKADQSETEKKDENLVKKPSSWIKERVEKAKKNLNNSEGGKLVWQSMEAHGGLENWFEKGALSFRFDYMPLGKGTARKTTSQVDIWSNKTIHQDVSDKEDTFGWDGENAWVHRNDTSQFSYNVRFWALTPYYFLGQPFIFDGEGVKIEKISDQEINNIQYDAVKITFEAGTGDAPDDYYINLYDKETHLLKALKYIVSYPSIFKNGGHSPEKTMVLYDLKTIEGIQLPMRYETFAFNDTAGKLGQKVTDISVSEVSFMPRLENDHFEIPQEAKIITEL